MDFTTDPTALRPTAKHQNDLGLPGAHDETAAGTVEPRGPNEGESFIVPEVSSVLSEMQTFFATQLMPRARIIEGEVQNLQYETQNVSDRADAEKNEVLKELDRLSQLVMTFQSRISQFLHFNAFGGQA
ncbi:hypothetical protein HYH03_012525 [Edaphochlamys debaryana]|uniref:Uncharacterized protein n=1 Tax=Edaphochlamys debaryana TaxID=47281 RepID=A0A835XSI8_9CHLO|nr:hypothetical protein HYH03_012525 [Edaphochlamys debaryana]|eukprot:KAG2488895.1 hypothetical protein HYH03_012525 [Edaphochlamys debaryana]